MTRPVHFFADILCPLIIMLHSSVDMTRLLMAENIRKQKIFGFLVYLIAEKKKKNGEK